MLSEQDNRLLTQTGEGTPMGHMFRFFWQPALLSEELPEPDCPPRRVNMLNKYMIAIRDSAGKAQLITPTCPHRGADLFFGRVEEGGIRCVYHGWKFDVNGRCLDVPTLPDNGQRQKMCEKIQLETFPTREAGGIIWVYLGPAEQMPEFPEFEFTQLPGTHTFASKKFQESNWAQACEGGLDTAHFSFLHLPIDKNRQQVTGSEFVGQSSADERRLQWIRNDGAVRFSIIPHEAGLVLGGARHADPGDTYWRVSQFLMPNHGLAPNALPGETMHGQCWVPIDDTSHWIFTYSWNPDRPLGTEEVKRFRSGASIHSEVDENYVAYRNKANDFLIDRVDQKNKSFTGIKGVSEQDAAIQISQGVIADRTKEHLNSSDLGVVQFRRFILDAARVLDNEGLLPIAHARPDLYRLRCGSHVCSDQIKFEDVMVERFGNKLGLAPDVPPQHTQQVAE
ncbi:MULTISPECIES: Rieske 2Fe-2S domain-containing protein [unclassified Beijerinckia]|uniref:Rieske 2Fe-2S domain-containing protein n=1 Tax=unclassified Beijerinckia TaxID=2638183 RepID=UPI00089C66C7|nr:MULTISPECIES: Rieske 2Fe-2S domain-containing protein [unclassified Beijerinckia]MDH7795300.1 phthalate 4,5-dioxygenase oxygenase subunit [Beijerinckia sp. GAS462]SEB95852.1 Rieske [2Fe-2S] domain-containing protein [Beijerinckia sp. 28-YEA-48]